MSRIDLINQYGNQQTANMISELQSKTRRLNEGVATIKTFAPRMKEIYDTAVACLNNGISLGPKDFLRDTKENCFITNGWSHYVGLLGRVDYFSGKTTLRGGFGKVGGGAFGWYLETDLEGNVTRLEGCLEDQLYVVESFVKGFDEFEKNFYAYVDKVVGKC